VAGYRSRTVASGRKLAITDVRRAGDDLVVTAEPLSRTGG